MNGAINMREEHEGPSPAPLWAELPVQERPVRPALHWALFGLTFLTTTFAGAAHQGVNLLRQPEKFAVGLPYSLALLSILGLHELGHYFTARYHGIRVTPPFFIPAPFALGTFGAFIQMRSPARDRKGLFDMAIAGPLAGLVVAIPALYWGLQSSTVIPGGAKAAGAAGAGMWRASILVSGLIKAGLGDAVRDGDAIRLGPLAFAGWLGLLITALNLIPVGQLDGGHIARAMFGGRAADRIGRAAMLALFLLALTVWPGLMTWAIIVFFLAGRGAPPLDDVTPLCRRRKMLGLFAFLLLVLILTPMPEGSPPPPEPRGMQRPYL